MQECTWACRSAFGFEWFATYYILANKKGYIEKENLRAVYGAHPHFANFCMTNSGLTACMAASTLCLLS